MKRASKPPFLIDYGSGLRLCGLVAIVSACGVLPEDPRDRFGRPVTDGDQAIHLAPDDEGRATLGGDRTDTITSALAPGFTLSPSIEAGHPGSWPSATAIGDVTGDGRADVVMTTSSYGSTPNNYRVFVYPQREDGTLGAYVSYPYSGTASRNGLVLVDLDENGILDVVVGHGQGVSVLLADGSGGFGPATAFAGGDSMVLATLDVDQDGHADIISLGWSRDSTIHFGDGLGSFARTESLVTNNAGYNDMEAGDVTGDGIADLVVMSGQSSSPYVSVHAGLAEGGFASAVSYSGLSSAPSGVGIGDVTGDGRNDVVLSRARNSPTHLWIMAQNTGGGLDAPMTIASYDIPEALEVGDLDGDGLEDIAVVHGGWSRVGVYQQLDAGALAAEARYIIPYASHYPAQGVALGDFSSDGCGDVAIADYNHGLIVLYGQSCAAKAVLAARESFATAPVCKNAATGCDSGVLVNGRNQITGGPEDRTPNTLGWCGDGVSGQYHVDESIDRIVIRSTSGGMLTAGGSAIVSVVVWAATDWTNDYLDIFVAANGAAVSWQLVQTIPAQRAGLQTLSVSMTLPATAPSGFQAVRAQWRRNGSAIPCAPGIMNERDDLAFRVN